MMWPYRNKGTEVVLALRITSLKKRDGK